MIKSEEKLTSFVMSVVDGVQREDIAEFDEYAIVSDCGKIHCV